MEDNNVLGFFGKLKTRFTKDKLEVELDQHINNLRVLVGLSTRASASPDLTTKLTNKTKKILTDFYKDFNRFNTFSKISVTGEIYLDLRSLLSEAIKNAEFLIGEIKKLRGNTVIKEGMTYQEINVLRSVPHYGFLVDYSMTMVNYMIACEVEGMGGPKEDFPKPVVDSLHSNAKTFAGLLVVYGLPPREFREQLSGLSKELVSDDLNERTRSLVIENTQKDLVPFAPKGFIGSPFYTLGSIFATWSVAKYQKLKDEQTVLNLRLNYYESLVNDGEPDPEVEKEIAYLQDSINTITRKIEKMEKSVQ